MSVSRPLRALELIMQGYILWAIFLGATVGYIVCARDTLHVPAASTSSGCCC